MSYLFDFEAIIRGYVAFGNPRGGKITGKGKIRIGKLDFDDVYFVEELQFNLFSVSHMCDKKNNVLFTYTEYIVLSSDFKLLDEHYVLLRVPRENNMYNNRVLVTKPHNKTSYELLHGRTPSIGFVRPFGCPVTILNTLDPLGKFDGKADEGFLVGYSNTDDDDTFEVKEPEFEVEKPESEVHVSPSSSAKTKKHNNKTKREAKGKSLVELSIGFRNLSEEFEDFSDNCINEVNATSTPVHAVRQISTNSTNTFSAVGPSNTAVSPTHRESSYVDPSQYPDDPNMPALEDIAYSDNEEDVGAEANFSNLETTIISMTRMVKDQGRLTQINNNDFHTCMFVCFLLKEEPKRVHQALKDPSLIEAMQEELLQFKTQKVWVLVDLLNRKRAIGTKWVFRNKKDKRGILVRNKARLVAQGHTQEEGVDYEEVFAPVVRIEAIQLFLDCAFFMGFMVYQMDVISAFLYGLKKSQDKYVAGILRNFGLTDGKLASTPIDTEKPLLKDHDGEDVDVHTYRSMIGSLMYLTSLRLNIMSAVCACAGFQVIPKASHLHTVKRIFRYLKGKPHLGLWYPKDSPFNLVAYSDSDYAGASLDRKSTTGGCQFLGCRLISWQCKKQTVVATSSTKAEYVAAASCYAQVL
nr:hypothetical protein [Tanacetum cinerariifolium]